MSDEQLDFQKLLNLKEKYRAYENNGYRFIYVDEDGALFFQKEIPEQTIYIDKKTSQIIPIHYRIMRLLETDMTENNFKYMTDKELSNFNKN